MLAVAEAFDAEAAAGEDVGAVRADHVVDLEAAGLADPSARFLPGAIPGMGGDENGVAVLHDVVDLPAVQELDVRQRLRRKVHRFLDLRLEDRDMRGKAAVVAASFHVD